MTFTDEQAHYLAQLGVIRSELQTANTAVLRNESGNARLHLTNIESIVRRLRKELCDEVPA